MQGLVMKEEEEIGVPSKQVSWMRWELGPRTARAMEDLGVHLEW